MEKNDDVSKVVSALLNENFFDGGERQNITQGTENSAPGQRANQMLAGILVGTGPATAFDLPSNAQFAGLNNLITDQANGKMGRLNAAAIANELTSTGFYEGSEEEKEEVLKLGHITDALKESGYEEVAAFLEEAYEDPTREDVTAIQEIAAAFKKSDPNSVMAEQLTLIAKDVAVLSVLVENNVPVEEFMNNKVTLAEAVSDEARKYISEILS